MSSSDKASEHCLYQEWMSLQEQELSELLQKSLHTSNNNPETITTTANDSDINELLNKIIKHFEDYADRRSCLVRRLNDPSAFFSPSWCTTFENSLLWVAGCRPSSYFSLVYALCGSDIESKLSEFFQDGSSSKFPYLSASQLCSIDNLQRRIILEEEKLSTKVATLQHDMVDMPLALVARKSGPDHQFNSDAKDAISKIKQAMVAAIEEADQLRVNTVKELFTILAPIQALEYIISAKKLRFCMQTWGLKRDRDHGRK
ncbi:hypothetical protein ACJIZ3_001699 [Penstemon smallii]|uniref:DOG1 domain-containing protein n=1 Tax=Penstemon smallii TaxID=265156 RepID=A0ABD3U4D8_9LAMI